MQITRFGDWSGAVGLVCALAGILGSVPLPAVAQCSGNPEVQLVIAQRNLFGDGQGEAVGNGDCPALDSNGDGEITAADLTYIVQSTPPLPPTPATGPAVVTFALAGADGTLISAIGGTAGSEIFQRAAGSGFQVVLEAVPGSAGSEVGKTLFNWNSTDPTVRPDLQIEASRSLGDGDPGVCMAGGIPGFDPVDFSLVQPVANALNDFSCGFEVNTNPIRACTVDAFGSPRFISASAHVVQFCLVVNAEKAFLVGDTVLTARVRDASGNLGAPAQIVVRIGSLPLPTGTASPSPTPVNSAIPTRSRTAAKTPTPTWTVVSRRTASPTSSRTLLPTAGTATPVRTPIASATRTAVAVATNTRVAATATRTGTATAGPPGTRTAATPSLRTPTTTRSVGASPTSPVPTATKTRAFTATPTVRPSATPTSLPSPTRPPMPSRTPTTSRTPTLTPTITLTATATMTATITRTPTVTRTPTPTIPPEPVITFFGVTRADDTLVPPIGFADDGTPIYQRGPYNFSLVIEARPGGTLADVGSSTFDWSPSSPTTLPDLQIEASNSLGNGSDAVCDESGSTQDGVPAVRPFDFSPDAAPAINDLSCRFKDGLGAPSGRTTDACTLFYPSGNYHFVDPSSTMQYCAIVTPTLKLPPGDTAFAARVRDSADNVSAVSTIIIRVL